MNEEMIEHLKGVNCQWCKSDNITENSITDSNGIFGPGYAVRKIFTYLTCLDCGAMFKKIEKK